MSEFANTGAWFLYEIERARVARNSALYAELCGINEKYERSFRTTTRIGRQPCIITITCSSLKEYKQYCHAKEVVLSHVLSEYSGEINNVVKDMHEVEQDCAYNKKQYAEYKLARQRAAEEHARESSLINESCVLAKHYIEYVSWLVPHVDRPAVAAYFECKIVFDKGKDGKIYNYMHVFEVREFNAGIEAVKLQSQQSNLTLEHCDTLTVNGQAFERFCAKLLLMNGFIRAETTSGSGDNGADILAEKDGITYAIQCKCYSAGNNVGNKAVQEIFSGREFYKTHIGVVLTNQYFTDAAKENARKTGIILWDRKKLSDLLKMAGLAELRGMIQDILKQKDLPWRVR